MRTLLLTFILHFPVLASAGPFDAPRSIDQPRSFTAAETNPYPPPALRPCRFCPVTIEFYTTQLTADIVRLIEAFQANQHIKNGRGLEINYMLVLDGHRFNSKGVSETKIWPKRVSLRPDFKAVQATVRGVKTFPTFYIKTPNETWLVLPHDINVALDQIYR